MKKNKFRGLLLTAFTALAGMLFAFKSPVTENRLGYSVIIKNHYWNNMHLQIRVGNNSNPLNNSLVFDGILKRDDSAPSQNFAVFCWYRRDANPDHPDGVHFSNWTSAGCFNNTPCVIDNP